MPLLPTPRGWVRLGLLAISAAAVATSAPTRTEPEPVRAIAALPDSAFEIATPPPTPVPIPVFTPSRIELPTLGVTAPVIPVGLDGEGAMGTPKSAHEVAWWDGVPVGGGNALLAGHRNWNRRAGSFGRLAELKAGQPILVSGEHGLLEFKVEWVRQVGGNADPEEFLGDTPRPAVTLITCGGEFDTRIRHYKDRVVVRATLA